MNQITININVPTGVAIDTERLKIVANDFIQKYVARMIIINTHNEAETKSTASFRKLRGLITSEKSYKEMLEDALLEKYGL